MDTSATAFAQQNPTLSDRVSGINSNQASLAQFNQFGIY